MTLSFSGIWLSIGSSDNPASVPANTIAHYGRALLRYFNKFVDSYSVATVHLARLRDRARPRMVENNIPKKSKKSY